MPDYYYSFHGSTAAYSTLSYPIAGRIRYCVALAQHGHPLDSR